MDVLFEKKMTGYDETKFRYDLDAYGLTVKESDFKQANIFANRVMSNSFIFNSRDFGIIGHILKEIASDGINVQQSRDEKLLNEYSKKSEKVLGEIVTMLDSNKIDLTKIWSHFSAQQDTTMKLFMSDYETRAYAEPDKDFSHEMIKNLMEILEENIVLLEYRSNNIYRGMLNEIGRMSKVSGLYNYDQHFVALLGMMQKIDEYVKQTSSSADFIQRSKKELIPLTKKVVEIYNSMNSENYQNETIDDFLWSLIKIWRLYFVKFMEQGQISYSMREEQIPEDPEKSKLVDEVTKYIEKEIGV